MRAFIRDYKDLIVWQKAIVLAKEVYGLTRGFPRDERFGLTSQLRRASVSVSSNIAEGHTRQGREFVRFLSIARGSAAEVESQLLLAVELGFVQRASISAVLDLTSEIRRMIASLSTKIANRSCESQIPLPTPNP